MELSSKKPEDTIEIDAKRSHIRQISVHRWLSNGSQAVIVNNIEYNLSIIPCIIRYFELTYFYKQVKQLMKCQHTSAMKVDSFLVTAAE